MARHRSVRLQYGGIRIGNSNATFAMLEDSLAKFKSNKLSPRPPLLLSLLLSAVALVKAARSAGPSPSRAAVSSSSPLETNPSSTNVPARRSKSLE